MHTRFLHKAAVQSRKTVTSHSLKYYRGVFYFLSLLVTLSVVSTAKGQSEYASTPPSQAAGSPAGSYALDNFETINLYNGHLNAAMPLLQISGRGSVKYSLKVPLQNHRWTVFNQPITNPSNGHTEYISFPEGHGDAALYKDYYGPGMFYGQTAIDSPFSYNPTTLTRFVFRTPDGSEHEFRDQLTEGKPYSCTSNCTSPFSRGTIFRTYDGSEIIFISDTEIFDEVNSSIGGGLYGSSYLPTGLMVMRDGTRYRINNGNVSWIQDRHGNRIEFYYEGIGYGLGGRLLKVKDSLNREVTITYGDRNASEWYDQINYAGFGGAPRAIKVWFKKLQYALRPDLTLKTKKQLFPSLQGNANDTNSLYNPTVISSVVLPNNKEVKFYYNSYVEIARVTLPTGGFYEYDYSGLNQPNIQNPPVIPDATGVINPNTNGCAIYRRLAGRRIFRGEGQLESWTSYDGVGFFNPVEVSYSKPDGNLIFKEKHYFYTLPMFPFSPSPVGYSGWNEGKEYKTEIIDSAGNTLRRVENQWQQKATLSWWGQMGFGYFSLEPSNNPRITETVTTLVDSNQVSKQTFSYDDLNNTTDVYSYDYGVGAAGALLRRTHTDYANAGNLINGLDYTVNSIHLIGLPTREQVFDGAGIEVARTTYEYDNYVPDTQNRHAALINYSDISGLCTWFTSGNQCLNVNPSDNSDPTGYKTRGNVTGVSRWLLSNTGVPIGDPVTSYKQYDIAGHTVKIIDPLDRQTTFDYTDRFGIPGDNEARANSAPAELSGRRAYGFLTSTTNALGQSIYAQYDYYQGGVVNAEDLNGVVTSNYYNDPLDRQTQVVAAANNADRKSQTTISFDDTLRSVTVTRDLASYNDNFLKSETLYDGLGRVKESRVYEGASYIATQRDYDELGRLSHTSNPYRPASESPVWTVTQYDALGRATTVTTPDGAQAVSTYHGNKVTRTDQAGKQRRSTINSLGQVRKQEELYEYPNTNVYATTNLIYDARGNLTKVLQENQTREFIYNSLGQLKSTMNPESGTVTYDYYSDGMLWKVTDARSITTQLEYDAINRVKTKMYLNDPAATPAVNYYYDAQSLPALPVGAPVHNRGASTGRLVAITYGSVTSNSGTYYGYDAVGLTTQSIQVTDGKAYGMSYDYNSASGMKSQTYPSGRTIFTNYDTTGRISSVTGQKSGESDRTYVSSIQYAPQGAVREMQFGSGANSFWEHALFNNRLQPKEIGLGTSSTDSSMMKLEYDYGTTNNNGSVQRQIITAPGTTALTLTQLYKYDQLNRLTAAQEVSGNVSAWQTSSYVWQQNYDYDKYGNRSSVSSTIGGSSASFPTFAPAPEVDEVTNQFKKINSIGLVTGFDYDPAGNLKQEPYALNRSVLINYTYDANNHLLKAQQGGSVVGMYVYDGAGKRVKKVDSGTTIFVYNILGQVVAEYSDINTASAGGTRYLIQDNLGSPRAIVNSGGEVIARHDYLPFGEEIGAGIGGRTAGQKYVLDNVRQKFTGYERDDETGLDFAQARYYGSAQGRFTSTDPLPASANIADPQSFNRYTYALNNPLMYVDPTGMAVEQETQQQNPPPPPQPTPISPLITGGNSGLIFDENGKIIGKFEIKTTVIDEKTFDAPEPDSSFDASNSMPSVRGIPGDQTRPLWMFWEFLTGWGERERQFGPDSPNTDSMRNSPDTNAHRSAFCAAMSCDRLSSYGPAVNKFGLIGWGFIWGGQDGLIRANVDPSRQFVGSFYITIRETNSDHDTLFTITNDTSRESFFYNREVGNIRSGPLGTKSQTYWWVEKNPCGCKPIGVMTGR